MMPKYNPDASVTARIENSFSYHAPKDDQAERYEAIRKAGKEMAWVIFSLTPTSREQSLSITALEEVVMRANQAIALNE